MKIIIVDGQGGKMGKMLVEQLKKSLPEYELIALGTNSIATSAMLKAGADFGATGENPVIFNCADADIIIGPLGIVIANSLLGEISPSMAQAIGQSKAHKILIPVNKCNNTVVGLKELPFNEYIQLAVQQVKQIIGEKPNHSAPGFSSL
ncbi:MAG: hypothetical protein HPY66_1085 [Firmicutes bacterium]|nr:hypothetical protein [Bacillota bacterium]MDI6706306.1 DUF3842 family protein [Bacillota bacterium]